MRERTKLRILNAIAIALIALLLAMLVACKGGRGGSSDTHEHVALWTGGLVGVYEPAGAPIAAIILHQGHTRFDDPSHDLRPIAQHFASRGFIVYAMEMPPLPHTHDLSAYVLPVQRVLDSIAPLMPVYMAGLSGGGATTSLVTALDTRVARGYSIAGDAPNDIHPIPATICALEVELCQNWRELYAQAGERLQHVYNCYEGGSMDCATFYGQDVGYSYVIDYSATQHTITPWAAQYIADEITNTLTAVRP